MQNLKIEVASYCESKLNNSAFSSLRSIFACPNTKEAGSNLGLFVFQFRSWCYPGPVIAL